MPRYSNVNIRESYLLNNPTSIRNRVPAAVYENLPNYDNLSADAKLSWGGDIDFDEKTDDLALTFSVESYAQRINNRLITQLGQFPEEGNFGWDFNYLYQMNIVEQRKMFPTILRNVRDSVLQDPDTLSVTDVKVYTELDETTFTHSIIVELVVRPRSINEDVAIVFELTPSGE
jgi:hypothetical protein